MVIDGTGIRLTPGNHGVHCDGNGEHRDEKGHPIACCCDECDDYFVCFPELEKSAGAAQ